MSLRRIVPLLWLALAAGVAPLRAQRATPPVTEAAPAAQSGLPLRDAPPRTLRAQAHVYIAFAIAWVLVFGYALWLGRRFARLERQIAQLNEEPPSA